jgi:hypothetical protein
MPTKFITDYRLSTKSEYKYFVLSIKILSAYQLIPNPYCAIVLCANVQISQQCNSHKITALKLKLVSKTVPQQNITLFIV